MTTSVRDIQEFKLNKVWKFFVEEALEKRKNLMMNKMVEETNPTLIYRLQGMIMEIENLIHLPDLAIEDIKLQEDDIKESRKK